MFIADELYSQILQVMPIPCVDLLVMDDTENVLLLRRVNEPATGQWWFPGGRVLFGEEREDAARRKLDEECGILATQFLEVGTFDLLLNTSKGVSVHFITTLFKVRVARESNIRLDSQSHEARWLTPHEWLKLDLPDFILERLMDINKP